MFKYFVVLSSFLILTSNAMAEQCGVASYYAGKFHGKKTASGERFNMHSMTAAHKSLRFGSNMRVVDQRTGKSVIVRINDRGPFVKGRIIDLSKESARQLGILNRGSTKVCIYNIKEEKQKPMTKKSVVYDYDNLIDKAMRKRKNEFIENVTQDVMNRTKGNANKAAIKKYINQKFNKMFKGEI